MSEDPEVEAVNLSSQMAILSDGQIIHITNWIDPDGEECAQADAAVAVAGPSKLHQWYTIDLSEFSHIADRSLN